MSEPATKRPWSQILLWVIAVTSLVLNLVVISALLEVRRQAGQAFISAAGMVGDFKSSRFDYTVNLDDDLPLAVNVPIDFTVQVPISETVPISTTVSVPVDIPLLGERIIEVPISTRIPVRLTVKVPIKQTIPIAANIPVKLDVPISIKIGDTPLGQSLDDVQLILLGLADDLGATASTSEPTATP